MEINADLDLGTNSIIAKDTTAEVSKTAAKLALQSAEGHEDSRTGKQLKKFSEKLIRKLALNEYKVNRSPTNTDSNNPLTSANTNADPFRLLNRLSNSDSKKISWKIEDKQINGQQFETEITIQTTDYSKNMRNTELKDSETIVKMDELVPKSTPEPDYEKIDLLDWNKLMVELKSIDFSYSRKNPLLDKVNMSVPKSAIYGLLGPSGCGKTTLLRIILGLIKPKSGDIKVNGKRPGDRNNNVPGIGVGFMPQELALYEEFTLNEALKYFSRIYGMSDEQIVSRIKFLVDFLDLPDPDRLIQNMSGGQKRRVSLSLSLVHNPPLLILDEPTVGTDPVLRERIWEHLVVLSKNESTTIIITTHYIEEARRAHVVSLMRNGKLLVEHSPHFLLKYFKVNNLEEVFLRVCKHESSDKALIPKNYCETRKLDEYPEKNENLINCKLESFGNKNSDKEMNKTSITYWQKVFTLTHKNHIRLIRNKPLLIFQTILPTICIIIFCLCIGTKPYNLNIALYNEEMLDSNLKQNKSYLSDTFLRTINNKTITIKHYETKETAIKAIDSFNDIYGALVFDKEFTDGLYNRFTAGALATDKDINSSTILFYADFTDMIISQTITKALIEAQYSFQREVISRFQYQLPNVNSRILDPFVQFMDPPIYGSLDPNFRDFIAPGIILAVIYIMAVGLTSLTLVVERKEGLMERTLVAGVKQHEILASQVILQFIIVTLQTILLMIFTFLVFQIPNRGNVVFIVLIVLLQGLTGMSFGLLISSICKDENSAIMAALGAFYPYFLLSGIIWPLEGMPYALRQISYFLPQTQPIISLRNIMLKGWSITHEFVYLGYISTIIWMFVFLLIAAILMRLRQ